MFKARAIQSDVNWLDNTGVKIYTIASHSGLVDQAKYQTRLNSVKSSIDIDWHTTPAFAIFHDGESLDYLVLVWWANDNELFTSVSVNTEQGWQENPKKYSFCLYDLEVMWRERNIYIDTIDCKTPSLENYQKTRN
ncbi:hypothetical protein [Thalassotalea sp. PLHSN55]|uniref:hypothetical protein n=1 Tax=Thalassotalea sp. PLHSN55 TaxID=3435888 RepID=UPI003F86B9B2